MQTLPEWMAWAVGGGAGILTWALVAQLKRWDKFRAKWDAMPPELGRILVFIVASVVAALLFWAQTALGYVPAPESPAVWVEMLFSVVASQLVHAGVKLAARKK